MTNPRSGNRRSRPADAPAEQRTRNPRKATVPSKPKTVSEADVLAPWRHYARRLAAKSARRLRDNAPNFLVVAPPKTATTWVYEILSTDRRFFMPEKECRYFSHFWREYPLASYYAQFQNPFGAVWRGEASPSYFILPSSVIATIRGELPDTKLIVLLRDPGERLWSHARHTFKYKEGWFRSSTAWRIEEVSETEWCHSLLHPVVRAFNDYAGPLARWAEHFPAEQILILSSEIIGAEPEHAAQQIYDFLGLEKPTPHSPLLHNRPNSSPRIALPNSVAELLAASTSAGRSRLEAALTRLPARLASDLRAAMAYWRGTDHGPALAATLPKPPGMPPQPDWDRLTTATFPPDLLSWSYHSAELPPNSELLHLASLNFEYSYFSDPLEKGMADEPLLRRVQTLGTSILEHDARLSGIERTAATLRERIGGLEAPDAIRDQRLRQLEQTIDERSARLSSLESSLEGYSELISSLAVRDTTREGRLAAIEAAIEEHTRRIGSTEAANAVREQRLGSLEQTVEERAGSLVTVESRLEELQRRVAAQEADMRETSARYSDRAAELETLLHQQIDRIAAVEHGAAERKTESAGQNRSLVELRSGLAEAAAGLASIRAEQQRLEAVSGEVTNVRSGLAEAAARLASVRAEQQRLQAVDGEVAELRSGLAEAAAGLASVRAEQQRLQALGGEVAELRATIEKALYAVALLQESLQGVEADLGQSRLSRIEAELSSVSAAREKSNSGSPHLSWVE